VGAAVVRAYQKPGADSTLVFWCENCDEWIEEYFQRTVMDIDNCSSWSFGGTEYYEEEEARTYEMYFCDSCNDPISLDSAPEMQKQTIWICGECNGTYTDQEAARECCS
jgi:hypothetical protein